MRKILLLLLLLLLAATPVAAQISVPNALSDGETIDAARLNTNFNQFADALNRTGGTMTGTLTTRNVIADGNNTRDIGATGTRYANVFSVLGDFSSTLSAAAVTTTGATTVGGLLTVSGFGTHLVSSGGTGGNVISVRNTTAGTANLSGLYLGNDGAAGTAQFIHTSSTYTAASTVPQDGLWINGSRVGGINIDASHASGMIRLGTVGTIRARVGSDGLFQVVSGGAAFDANYGRAFQAVGPGSNFGQLFSMVRSGAAIWSLGYAYNTSTFAIGPGETTDSNFTAAAAALTITTAKEVQFPNQPGFLAYNSVTDSNITSGATIEFDTEVYDESGDFNNTTDTFTAPVTGRYLLCVSAESTDHSGDTLTFNLVTSNRTYQLQFGSGSAQAGRCVIADMDAADTAHVTATTTSSTADITGASNPVTYFSGRLMP